MKNIAHTDCFLHIFIGINGRDTAAGRTEFCVAETILFKAIEKNMVRHANGCAVAYFKVCGSDFNAAFAEFLHLVKQMLDVDHHTGTENVNRIFS